MTHDEAREELEAYVAGLLDAPRQAALDDHLEGCDMCRRELNTLGQTLDAFVGAMVQPDWNGHEDLRRRFAAALPTDAADAPGRAPSPAAPLPTRPERKRPAPGRPANLLWPVAWAATLLLAIGGWSLYARTLPSLHRQSQLAAVMAVGRRMTLAPAHAPDAQVALFIRGSHAVVSVSRLPTLAAGEVYEGWWVIGSRPVPAGTFGSGLTLLSVRRGAVAFAITIEPAGGTAQPTRPILAETSL